MGNEKNALFIANQILKYIKQKNVGENTRLPSENTLAELYGVNRNVVRAAYSHLRSQGYVHSVKGKGYYPVKRTRPLIYQHRADIGFSEIFRKNSSEYENILINWKLSEIKESECQLSGLPVGEKIYRLKTLRSMKGKVFALCYSTIPQKHVPGLELHFENYQSINKIFMDDYGFSHPVCDSISIKAQAPAADDMKHLGIPENIPILSIACCFSTPETGVIEYFVIHARSDMFTFHMDFKQEEH
ncbi:MAG: GntR family transcriptional regulator [Roseburia sp.]|nr:GntR family transcriptional regulator [Roseburia sp.]